MTPYYQIEYTQTQNSKDPACFRVQFHRVNPIPTSRSTRSWTLVHTWLGVSTTTVRGAKARSNSTSTTEAREFSTIQRHRHGRLLRTYKTRKARLSIFGLAQVTRPDKMMFRLSPSGIRPNRTARLSSCLTRGIWKSIERQLFLAVSAS